MTMKWDVSSITQLAMAAVSIFMQVWGMLHGAPFDPIHGAVGVGLAASGLGHAANSGTINGK